MRISTIAVAALLFAAGAAQAEPAAPQCQVNYKQEGGLLTGRRFTTFADVDVPPAKAFKTLYGEVLKTGFRMASSDKDMGTLNAEQLTNYDGQAVTIPWNILIEAHGAGSRITVAKSTPPGYPTSEKGQRLMMCSVMDSAKK